MIVYAVNNYVWALLKKRLNWSTVTSKNLIPIFPAQQQPEAMNSDEPFILYSSSLEANTGELEPHDAEIISYVIFAGGPNKEDDVDAAVTLIKDAFKSFSSAETINAWVHSPINETIDVRDQKDMITYTEVMNAESSGESTSEGGKVDGFVQVRVGYQTTPGNYKI